MQKTSHFIWIEINSYLLSDIFIKVYNYLKINSITEIISFQNPLSTHITLYYLDEKIDGVEISNIKNIIKDFDIKSDIFINWFEYFKNWNWDNFLLYLKTKSKIDFKFFRDNLHKKYQKSEIYENNLEFIPHISIFKINNFEIFKIHQKEIEKIINEEINKIYDKNINSKKIYLYAANSNFTSEIQIKL